METKNRKIKVGAITLALGLVALGTGMLAYNLGGIKSPETVWRMWPLLLIGLGLEYFIRRAARGEREIEFSIPSVLLILLFILTGVAANAFSGLGIGNVLENVSFGQDHRHVRDWQSEPVNVAKGSSLEITNNMGEIDLEPSPDGKLHVFARITGRASSEAGAKAAAEAAKVILEQGQITRIYTDRANVPAHSNISTDFRIQLPGGMVITADNKMGRISSSHVEGHLELKSDMGEINVEDARGNINATSKMGSVNIKKATGNIDASTDMGGVYIEDPGAEVRAGTRMGELELISSGPLNESYDLNTDNGRILFSLPGQSNLTIEAKTRRGSISGLENVTTGQNGINSSGRLTLGSGQGTARLTAGNGKIDVETH